MRHLTSGQLVLWLSLLAAACGAEGASENDANPTTDGGFPDARPTCLVNVTFTPSQAQASAGTVRA